MPHWLDRWTDVQLGTMVAALVLAWCPPAHLPAWYRLGLLGLAVGGEVARTVARLVAARRCPSDDVNVT